MTDLDTSKDEQQMARVIEQSPDQLEFALRDRDFPRIPSGPFDAVVVAGMGGSALPVDVLRDAFGDALSGAVAVASDYSVAVRVANRTLVVASSFSGDTEETISALESLPDGFENLVVLAAGGELARIAERKGVPLVRIPKDREPPGFQPRSATGYMVTYLARILSAAGFMKDPTSAIEELVTFMRGLRVREDAEELARALGRSIPVFYTDERYVRSIGRISKIKFNENAKRPAFFNALPEANHNEMIGFVEPIGEFTIVYLRDPDSDPRVHERFSVMKQVFASEGLSHVSLREWEIPGRTALQKIFASLTFADWLSYSAAMLGGRNPTPVDLVQDFKRALKEVRATG